MQVRHALIAAIGDPQLLQLRRKFGLFEEAEIMAMSLIKGGADDHPCQIVHHHLRFQRMPPLLATVKPTLVFFGRSMGHSVTSTSSTLSLELG